MKRSSKIVIDILIAIAISLVVNFSHLMLIFVDQDPQMPQNAQGPQQREGRRVEGRFLLSPDGHGYVLFNQEDSAYVAQGRVSRYGISNGDTLIVSIIEASPDSDKHSVVQNVLRRNGNVVAPYSTGSPQRVSEFVTQTIYYLILSLLVILVATSSVGRHWRRAALKKLMLALAVAVILYFFAPLVSRRYQGDLIIHLLLRNQSVLDYMIILKWLFAVIVSLLYSQIYLLLSQRQNIMLENERLRSESIDAQYNMLMSQINPHVFFNSLNSLAMLVRERDEQRSLTYIDQLSYTFRYILQNRESTLTTLAEEMRFVDAYIYLFKIRYADKLFFDIDIDEQYDQYQIPALSLQPLLDNAVKHNIIVSSRPFHVSIKVEDGVMVVSNNKYPKLEPEPSTGVGLENLSRRWSLIASNPLEVIQDDLTFTVKLPLTPPQK